MAHLIRRIKGLCLLLALLAACSASAQRVSADTTKPLAPFMVQDVSGRQFDATHLRNKVVFINFWSLTCVPCKAELPTISNLRAHFANDTNLYIFPIDLDRNLKEDVLYFKRQGFFLNPYVCSGVVLAALFKGELPTTVVLDGRGHMAYFRQGEQQYDTPEFYAFVGALLRK